MVLSEHVKPGTEYIVSSGLSLRRYYADTLSSLCFRVGNNIDRRGMSLCSSGRGVMNCRREVEGSEQVNG